MINGCQFKPFRFDLRNRDLAINRVIPHCESGYHSLAWSGLVPLTTMSPILPLRKVEVA